MWCSLIAPMDHSFYGLTLGKYFHKVSPQWCLSIPNYGWSFNSSWKNTTDFILFYFKILCIIWEYHRIYFHHILSYTTNLPPVFLPDLYPRSFSIQILNTDKDLSIQKISQKYHKGIRTSTYYTPLSTVLKVPTTH